MDDVVDELRRSGSAWIASALAAAAAGAAVTINLEIAFLLVLACYAVAALAAPASAWALAALVAALTFRGLVQLHVLPGIATFIDLPLSWGALALGLIRMRPGLPYRRRLLGWLALLAFAVLVAWAFNPSEVLRPVLYLTLLGEPFAIVGALLAEPPSPMMRRALTLTLFALVVVQIPLSLLQLATLGAGDHIQGTLYGAGAGAHVISAVILVGAVWLLAGRRFGGWRIPILVVLAVIPFLADAKQVIVATPAMLLATNWRGGRLATAIRFVLVAAMVVALFTLDPAGRTGLRYISTAGSGQGGKQAAASFVWHKVDGAPASLIFGRGPAETVSRAAFETLPTEQVKRSPLASLGLKPAAIAAEAQAAAQAVSPPGATSVDTGISSTLGVLGDLGIFGLAAYGGLLLSLLMRLRRQTSPEGVAAASGFALFLVLGLVLDWWEQPPFGVFIGVLAGLSLSAGSPPAGTEASGGQEGLSPPQTSGHAATKSRILLSGLHLSTLSLPSVIARIQQWIEHGEHHYVCLTSERTATLTQRDRQLAQIYNSSGLTILDTIPSSWDEDLAGRPAVPRIQGRELLLALCALAAQQHWSCYFYGGLPGTAERLATRLATQFPGLPIAGMSAFDGRTATARAKINASGAKLVWVGAPSPDQEQWMFSNVGGLDAAAVIGLGSAFELYAGTPTIPSRRPGLLRRTVQYLRSLVRPSRR